jgi:beta-glucanase (GH16 family)
MNKHSCLLLLLPLLFGNCKTQQKTSGNKHWKLIWEDQFNGPELDTTKWTRISKNNADWGRHMTTDPQCYALKDGKMFLKGINNPDTLKDPRPFLTGGIYSKDKFAFKYGKIEIHAKLECAQGAWPAMWMLPEKGKWPDGGEIDIMEHLNFDSIIYQTTHSRYTHEFKQKNTPLSHATAGLNIAAFNTFGLEWYPDRLVFTLNGKETFTYPRVENVDPSQWPFDQPFYILIDQQLGGNWVGKVHPAHLPVHMIVDWVKVYQ